MSNNLSIWLAWFERDLGDMGVDRKNGARDEGVVVGKDVKIVPPLSLD